jgi:hypothetical protein
MYAPSCTEIAKAFSSSLSAAQIAAIAIALPRPLRPSAAPAWRRVEAFASPRPTKRMRSASKPEAETGT